MVGDSWYKSRGHTMELARAGTDQSVGSVGSDLDCSAR